MFLVSEEYSDYDAHSVNNLFLVDNFERAEELIEIMEKEKKAVLRLKVPKPYFPEDEFDVARIRKYNEKIRAICKVYPYFSDETYWNEYKDQEPCDPSFMWKDMEFCIEEIRLYDEKIR